MRTRWNVSLRFRSNWNLEVLVFEERGKPEYPEKNLSEQGREPTTNSTHIWRRRQDSNPGHIGGRTVLSPLRQALLPKVSSESWVGKFEFLLNTVLNKAWSWTKGLSLRERSAKTATNSKISSKQKGAVCLQGCPSPKSDQCQFSSYNINTII